MIAREATIIPYLGRCEMEKDGQPFILKSVPIFRSTTLVFRVKDKQVIQAQRKFFLTTKGNEEELKIKMDQSYQQYILIREIRVPIMSIESFRIGRIRVPMFSMDMMWKETSNSMDQAMGSIDSQ